MLTICILTSNEKQNTTTECHSHTIPNTKFTQKVFVESIFNFVYLQSTFQCRLPLVLALSLFRFVAFFLFHILFFIIIIIIFGQYTKPPSSLARFVHTSRPNDWSAKRDTLRFCSLNERIFSDRWSARYSQLYAHVLVHPFGQMPHNSISNFVLTFEYWVLSL